MKIGKRLMARATALIESKQVDDDEAWLHSHGFEPLSIGGLYSVKIVLTPWLPSVVREQLKIFRVMMAYMSKNEGVWTLTLSEASSFIRLSSERAKEIARANGCNDIVLSDKQPKEGEWHDYMFDGKSPEMAFRNALGFLYDALDEVGAGERIESVEDDVCRQVALDDMVLSLETSVDDDNCWLLRHGFRWFMSDSLANLDASVDWVDAYGEFMRTTHRLAFKVNRKRVVASIMKSSSNWGKEKTLRVVSIQLFGFRKKDVPKEFSSRIKRERDAKGMKLYFKIDGGIQKTVEKAVAHAIACIDRLTARRDLIPTDGK